MVSVIKSIGIRILEAVDWYSVISLKQEGPLKDDGWFRSYKEKYPVDGDGNPLPWITYPAIEFLKRRVNRDLSVFEYGCGGSTLWWSSRVREVVSVEHDREWFLKMSAKKPANVSMYQIDLERNGAYSKKIGSFANAFDIIVIDGRDRVNCARNSLGALKRDGVIIWDNSDRSEYQDGYDFLFRHGFKKLEFVGLCPGVNLKTETGIFYKTNNVLSI